MIEYFMLHSSHVQENPAGNVKIPENEIGTLQPSKLAGSEAAVAPNSSTGVDMQEPCLIR
jgi:hypothetical protein